MNVFYQPVCECPLEIFLDAATIENGQVRVRYTLSIIVILIKLDARLGGFVCVDVGTDLAIEENS